MAGTSTQDTWLTCKFGTQNVHGYCRAPVRNFDTSNRSFINYFRHNRVISATHSRYIRGFISYPRTESTAYPHTFDLRGTLARQRQSRWYGASDLPDFLSCIRRVTYIGEITSKSYWRTVYKSLGQALVSNLSPSFHNLIHRHGRSPTDHACSR